MQNLPLYETYLPVAAMLLVALGFAAGTIVISCWILPKFLARIKPSLATEVKLAPYECGIPAVGDARSMFFVRFYMVALAFLLFDMETIYLLVWALCFRGAIEAPGGGAYMLAIMAVYLGVLTLGLVYEWKKGALKWS